MKRNTSDVCEVYYVNEKHVEKARKALSPEREIWPWRRRSATWETPRG